MRRAAPVLAGLALAACAAPERPADVGRAAFAEHCAACHGAGAAGDGPMAIFVPSGVPNLRELAQRNGGTYPERHVVEVVTRISDKHDEIVAMPDFGALLAASPTVYTAPDGTRIGTDATILAISAYLAGIQEGGA